MPPEYGEAWVATLRDVWVQQMRSDGKQDKVFDPSKRERQGLLEKRCIR